MIGAVLPAAVDAMAEADAWRTLRLMPRKAGEGRRERPRLEIAPSVGFGVGALGAVIIGTAFALGAWVEGAFGAVPAVIALAVVLVGLLAVDIPLWRRRLWDWALMLAIGAVGYPIVIWIVLTGGF